MGAAQDFAQVARRPQLVALGAALQFTIMPAMGFAVSRALQLPLPFSVGCVRMPPAPSLHLCPAPSRFARLSCWQACSHANPFMDEDIYMCHHATMPSPLPTT